VDEAYQVTLGRSIIWNGKRQEVEWHRHTLTPVVASFAGFGSSSRFQEIRWYFHGRHFVFFLKTG
jgi:hypothetical protein